MPANNHAQKEWVSHQIGDFASERELVEDLILQNKTLDALIKGLSGDIEIFKKDKKSKWGPADIVRFTMQLNIMHDKKVRNLAAINKLIKNHKGELSV